ncbi:WxL domain-containing protein [Lederbergia lenta]|uniref:WxL domain-containing protein n=1 Tax=Lederbergia lenta TaxID=1467 RepID=UPI002041F825|nr:WxL domain-containing protein [Lederbergia lenta]MCM3113644.1 WxL domain-containing protein [Lederbergia lenta]
MKKKLLGLATTLLLLPSMIGSIQVNASSNDQTPTLNVYKEGSTTRLEWAIEMLDEDVLYRSGFETGDELPELKLGNQDKAGGLYGGQSITNEEAYSGKMSLKIHDTFTNGQVAGNLDLDGNPTYSNFSRARFLSKKYIPNGTDLAVSFRAKTNGSGKITPVSAAEYANYPLEMSIKFTEKVKAGSNTAKVSDPGYFKRIVDQGKRFYLARNRGAYTIGYVTSVDMNTSTITLSHTFLDNFEAGDPVLQHQTRTPATFPGRSFTNNGGWQLFNVNTKVEDFIDYDTLKSGLSFTIHTETKETVYVDDIKMGYATKAQLYRDGVKLYEGYLSDYTDTFRPDTVKPDKVERIKHISEDGKEYITVTKPKDNGTTYNYVVKALAHNGATLSSEVKSIDVISEIKGYSYVIDNKVNTIPSDTVNSTTGKIEIPYNANAESYLHIKAIDNANNISETTHIHLKDFVNKKLEVTVPNILPFEKIVLQEQPKTYKTSFNSSFKIKNYYPRTGEGWRLSVSASPLKLVGEPYTLPNGTISLEPISSIKKIGNTVGNIPTKTMTNKEIIDNGEVIVLGATSGNGIGEYEVAFPNNALNIVIDPTTTKTGKYQSTLTWNLVLAP